VSPVKRYAILLYEVKTLPPVPTLCVIASDRSLPVGRQGSEAILLSMKKIASSLLSVAPRNDTKFHVSKIIIVDSYRTIGTQMIQNIEKIAKALGISLKELMP